MTDLRKATEELIKEWDWECGEHQNKALAELIEALRQALAQPEQEPVLWMMPDGKNVDKWGLQFYGGVIGKPLYTAPPKREWVGLTDEESVKLLQKAAKHKSPNYCTAPEMAVEFGRLASEALKEKNT